MREGWRFPVPVSDKSNIAGLVIAAAGIGTQIAGGVAYPTVPPRLINPMGWP